MRCDKSCDVGEFIYHESCKCRKKLVDELIEECTENIQETKLVEKTSTENELKCSSCTVCKVLFWIFFILFLINVGIGTYFTYYKYITSNKENTPKHDYTYQRKIYSTYKWEKSKSLTLKIEHIFILTT